MPGGRASLCLWRLCNLLMAAFFGLAAAVQVRAVPCELGAAGGGRAALLCAAFPRAAAPALLAAAGSQCASLRRR